MSDFNDVKERLAQLGFERLREDRLKSILAWAPDAFYQALGDAETGTEDGFFKIQAALASLSDFLTGFLLDHNVSLSLEQRVKTGMNNYSELLSLIKQVNTSRDPNATRQLITLLREKPSNQSHGRSFGEQGNRNQSGGPPQSGARQPNSNSPDREHGYRAPSGSTANQGAQRTPASSQRNPAPQGSSSGQERETRVYGKTIHFYGGKAAFCFSEDVTRESEKTVRIEAAKKVGDGYDWQNKSAIQLTTKELLPMLAVLMRQIPSYEFKNHGKNSEKSVKIVYQQAHSFYISMMNGDRNAGLAIPVPAHEMYLAVCMVTKVLNENWPHLPANQFMQLSQHFVMEQQGNAQRNAA